MNDSPVFEFGLCHFPGGGDSNFFMVLAVLARLLLVEGTILTRLLLVEGIILTRLLLVEGSISCFT